MTELRTRRLLIRSQTPDDFEAMQALVSDYEVVKWTASWPWPPDPAFTRERLGRPVPEMGIDALIFEGDRLAGGIGIGAGSLGYMLGRPFHGRGIATEACTAILDWAFGIGHEVITAGAISSNEPSLRVLTKLGFTFTDHRLGHSRAQGKDLPATHFALTRAAWTARRPIEFPARHA